MVCGAPGYLLSKAIPALGWAMAYDASLLLKAACLEGEMSWKNL